MVVVATAGVVNVGVVVNAGTIPVEVTSAPALPVIGTVPGGVLAVGGGSNVGGVGTPLNDGVPGMDVMVAGDVTVTGLVIVAATAVVIGTDVPALTALVPVNCAETGSDVKVPPLKARPSTPMGTLELINSNPVTP